jgi:hypothetical protein
MVLLKGEIVCEAPLSITLPQAQYAKPTPAGAHLKIKTASGDKFYINAPTIRSAIRHAATELMHEISGRAYHLDDYFLAALGGIKDAGKEGKEADDGDEGGKPEDAALRAANVNKAVVTKFDFAKRKNPLLMLFGSMGIPGAVECSHAIHAIDGGSGEPQRFAGVRANDFRRNPAVVDMLEPGAIDNFVARQAEAAIRSQVKNDAAAVDRDLRKAKEKKDAALIEALTAKKKQLDEDKRNAPGVVQLQTLLDYYAIPQGTKFSHEWSLKRVRDLELALFVQSIALWAMDPKLGGHRNHGLGRVSGHWNVTVRDAGQTRMRSMGTLKFDGYGELEAHGEIAKYLDPDILLKALPDLDLTWASLAALG